MNLLATGLAVAVCAVDSESTTLLFVAWIPIIVTAMFIVKTRRHTPHMIYFSVYMVNKSVYDVITVQSTHVLSVIATLGSSIAVIGALMVFTRLVYERRGYYTMKQAVHDDSDSTTDEDTRLV
jgi:hypothetical protein